MLDGAPAADDQPLQLGLDLFDRLNRSGVRYCHWKSNVRLGKSLAGKTDLDLLVAKKDLDRFVATAKELGFRRMINRPEREYEGLSDFLGMDSSSGGLLHIHLHDRLVLGGRSGKDVELPIETLFWSNLERVGSVWVPVLDLELIVLLLRAVLKSKPSGNSNPQKWFPADIVDEVAVLYHRRDEGRFAALLGEMNLGLAPVKLLRMAAALAGNCPNGGELLSLRAEVLAALSPYRARAGMRSRVMDWRRTFFDTRWAKKNLLARRKRLRETGLSVALIGADGSGKSTHAEDLRRWLSWKLLCRKEYFGLSKASRVYRSLSRRAQTFEKRARTTTPATRRHFFRLLADLAQSARWLWAAHLRASDSRRVARLTRRGAVVICDRYPLSELSNADRSMDGPRIRHERGSFLGTAALEEWIYRNIRRPDLAIVLTTSVDELRRRKPELDAAVVTRKVALVSGIKPSPNLVIVDNERPYAEVRLDLRRLIWQHLQETTG